MISHENGVSVGTSSAAIFVGVVLEEWMWDLKRIGNELDIL